MNKYEFDSRQRWDRAINKGVDFKMTFEDDEIVAGFSYHGRIIDLETDATVKDFDVDLDVPNKEVTFSLEENETAGLTIGNYLYITIREDNLGFSRIFAWGYIPVYNAWELP
jgi:hypothetical protein